MGKSSMWTKGNIYMPSWLEFNGIFKAIKMWLRTGGTLSFKVSKQEIKFKWDHMDIINKFVQAKM